MRENTSIIQTLADKDLMPPTDVVGDFYKTAEIEPALTDQWEPLPEHELGDVDVPGYPDICPYKAWQVQTVKGTWMVYSWYEGTGYDDDVWLYVQGDRDGTTTTKHRSPSPAH